MANTNEGAAVLSYGTKLFVKDPITREKLLVGGLTDFNGPQTSRGEIETTTLASTAKEYALDLKDMGTFTSTMQTRYGNPAQRILLANMDSTETLAFELVLPDDGYGNGEVFLPFEGRVQSFPVQGSKGQVITTSLSIRITGDVIPVFPDSQGTRLIFTPTLLAESSVNDGTVAGVVSVVLAGDTLADPLAGVTFSGVPAGLSAQAARISPNTVIINFSGSATASAAGTKAEVGVNFADAAFVTLPAASVAGASGRQITINFV